MFRKVQSERLMKPIHPLRSEFTSALSLALTLAVVALAAFTTARAQAPDDLPPGPPPGGPGGRFGGPPPGGVREDRKVVSQFDKDGDKRLNLAERKAAREFLAKEPTERRGPGGRGPRGPREDDSTPPKPGPKVSVADAKTFPDAPLYSSNIVRTFFLEFENADWEKELGAFHGTDVEVAAKLTVDGKVYPDVGVHFRGSSSYGMVGEGRKRSFNLSLDFVHEDQRLHGHRTINLLNSHRDPSFLRSILYYHVARHYLPAPQANHAKVVVNGESWGIYVNVQQFNKDFIRDWFADTKGARWKVPGSPRGNAGLAYLGDDVAEYKKKYDLKTKEDPKAWAALIRLCKTLTETPPEQLEAALAPQLDIDQALSFLALENIFINSDGYWTRASDYELYLDAKGRFHIIPYDGNETFNFPERGGRMGGGEAVTGVELEPFAGSSDSAKPLLNRLLKVPALRTRYLERVRDIATKWLDWQKLGPLAQGLHETIAAEVKIDTRKLSSTEAFERSIGNGGGTAAVGGRDSTMTLKQFIEERRRFLLNHPEIKKPEERK